MMNFSTVKGRLSILAMGAILLNPAWAATASGTHIQVGGGQRLNISRLQVVHQETFDSSQAPESIFWGALDVGKRPNDPWAGMLTKGVYALTHTGQPGKVRYYFRQYLDPSENRGLSAYPLSVEVSGTMNEKKYRWRPVPGSWPSVPACFFLTISRSTRCPSQQHRPRLQTRMARWRKRNGPLSMKVNYRQRRPQNQG
jgi:hypothetical protein